MSVFNLLVFVALLPEASTLLGFLLIFAGLGYGLGGLIWTLWDFIARLANAYKQLKKIEERKHTHGI